MKSHRLWMVLGAGLPLLFIFFAPSFGIGEDTYLFIFIIAMFASHLLMPHGSHDNGEHNHSEKQDNHEHSKGTSSVETKKEHEGHRHH